jgi:hypothetical protein
MGYIMYLNFRYAAVSPGRRLYFASNNFRQVRQRALKESSIKRRTVYIEAAGDKRIAEFRNGTLQYELTGFRSRTSENNSTADCSSLTQEQPFQKFISGMCREFRIRAGLAANQD